MMPKIRNKIYLVSSLLILWSFVQPHDYHVSITEIHYNEGFKSINIAHQLFIDDLERALEGKTNESLSIGLENQDSAAVLAVIDYIYERFQLSLNTNTSVKSEFVGFEWEDHHELWFYFEVKGVKSVKSITIENKFMIDLFDEQENMHYVYFGDDKTDLLLNKDQTRGTLNAP